MILKRPLPYVSAEPPRKMTLSIISYQWRKQNGTLRTCSDYGPHKKRTRTTLNLFLATICSSRWKILTSGFTPTLKRSVTLPRRSQGSVDYIHTCMVNHTSGNDFIRPCCHKVTYSFDCRSQSESSDFSQVKVKRLNDETQRTSWNQTFPHMALALTRACGF